MLSTGVNTVSWDEQIRFPSISKWDGVNATQIISPVDNPERVWTYGRTNNSLSRITKLHPKDACESGIEWNREAIWLTGIMHRNPNAMIDFYDTLQKQYWAIFTFFDNPKASYDLNCSASQVVDYLKQMIASNPEKEFIIFWASAWEMLSRKVYEKLNNPELVYILSHIVHHFSVGGVSTYDELSLPQKWLIQGLETKKWKKWMREFSQSISVKINNTLGEWVVTKVIGDTFFAPVGEKFSKKLWDAWESRHGTEKTNNTTGEHLNRTHRKRGAMSLTEAHYDILKTIGAQKSIKQGLRTPSATILYSTNDPTYSNPESNARVDAWFYKDVSIKGLQKAGHVDVVFQSEKYLEPITATINTLWK